MSHITQIKLGITSADVASGILERTIQKLIPESRLVNEATLLNAGRGAAWETSQADAYILEDGMNVNQGNTPQIGFKVEDGNYNLIGDFYYHAQFSTQFPKMFLNDKVLASAEASNMYLTNTYTNPQNADEQVFEFETNG